MANTEAHEMSEKERKLMAGGVIVAIAMIGSLFIGTARSVAAEDVWQAFRPLVGKWKGEGSGFGTVSDVTHEWDFVLAGQFLELRTRSVPHQTGASGEIHVDVGFISRDTDRGIFVFRQFLSEGFVNTYDVSVEEEDDKPTLVFSYRETESAGGMQARMRLTFLSENEYEMSLDLAAPGKDFSPCQQMHMKKIQ